MKPQVGDRKPTSLPRKRQKPRSAGPKLPKWIRAIPEGSHGSGTLQKRLWRLTSDCVRIRDWHKFGGICIASGVYIPSWRDGQAGHFKPWSKCNGIFKFNRTNIHLQAEASNKWHNSETWFAYAEEMERRWGYTKESLDLTNSLTDLKTLGTENLLNEMEIILLEMAELPERPDYYHRVVTLKRELKTI